MLLMYGWGVIPSVYLLSFFFKTPSSGYVWTSIINYFTGWLIYKKIKVFIKRIYFN